MSRVGCGCAQAPTYEPPFPRFVAPSCGEAETTMAEANDRQGLLNSTNSWLADGLAMSALDGIA